MTFLQRRIKVEATSWRRIDDDTTLPRSHVPAVLELSKSDLRGHFLESQEGGLDMEIVQYFTVQDDFIPVQEVHRVFQLYKIQGTFHTQKYPQKLLYNSLDPGLPQSCQYPCLIWKYPQLFRVHIPVTSDWAATRFLLYKRQ